MNTSILKIHKQELAIRAFDRLAVFIETAPERLLATLYTWQARITSRSNLQKLNARMLVDIGLDRADIEQESQKHFWQA